MGNLARPLLTDTQIYTFLTDTLDIGTYLTCDQYGKKLYAEDKSVDMRISKILQKILDANKDLYDVLQNNTLVSDKYRLPPFKNETERKHLREEILMQLVSQRRPEDEESISYLNGGMLPRRGNVEQGKKVYIIIGLPASGKSVIARIVSDKTKSILIDSDFVKRCFPEYVKVNGATLVHEESKNISSEIRQISLYQGRNIVLPIIGAEYHEMENMIASFKERLYDPYVIFVELDRVKATRRALYRFLTTNRYLPLNKIMDEYAQGPALSYYKLIEKLPQGKYILIDTDVNTQKGYKKVSFHSCIDLYNML